MNFAEYNPAMWREKKYCEKCGKLRKIDWDHKQ
jgi:hypothetical protein